MQEVGVTFHDEGTYLVMEGPQFSTKAESLLYRENWRCDVIGMTNMPEAKLAREAEICYAPIAMVTDFDCWHPDHENVEVSDIIKTLTTNATTAKSLVKMIATILPTERDLCIHGCDRALEYAIITDRSKISDAEKERLRPVSGRLLG
jgi:5'-methylthioadenosine phosphorylase